MDHHENVYIDIEQIMPCPFLNGSTFMPPELVDFKPIESLDDDCDDQFFFHPRKSPRIITLPNNAFHDDSIIDSEMQESSGNAENYTTAHLCISSNIAGNAIDQSWCYFGEEAITPCSQQWAAGLEYSDHNCNSNPVDHFLANQSLLMQGPSGESPQAKEDRHHHQQPIFIPTQPRATCSNFSNTFYGGSFRQLALVNQVESPPHHEESTELTDCFASCPMSLVQPRPRTDPSNDPQFLELGTVRIPIRLVRKDTTWEEITLSLEKFSLDLFCRNCEVEKTVQPHFVQIVEDGCCPCSYQHSGRLHNYRALLEELMLNEAQGQIQVVVTVRQVSDNDSFSVASIRVFVKRERGEEFILLKELFREMFPEEASLQKYLAQVEEMQRWAATSDEWTSFGGLLSDLESNGYHEAKQPSGLSVPLRPYQLQSLQFMLDAENREGGLLSINYHRLPRLETTGEELMYSATFGHLTEAREGISRGGFLCEEMGLGKTIEILALILANPCPAERFNQAGYSKGTLVVCPVSIVGQWANEVKGKLAANLSIYMYHGSKRIRDPKRLAKYDIVITTYATLGSDFSKATQATRHGSGFAEQFCPLLSVNWWRVVLDESHTVIFLAKLNVKDPAPLHSRACAKLKADRRWCCTGTPINTSIYDLYGQFWFLRLEPLDNKNSFRRRIGRPYERHSKNEDQTVLLWTLNKMMMRHTKLQKFNGRELLKLPPKTEQEIPVVFSTEERIAYDAVYKKVLAKFEQFRSWGPTIVSKNILQIMSLLLPLRSGGFVSNYELNAMEYVKRDSGNVGNSTDTFSADNGKPLVSNERELEEVEGECGMCFELMECPTKTPCDHWFCLECVMSTIGAVSQACPICKRPITADQLVTYQKGPGVPFCGTASANANSSLSGNNQDGAHMVTGIHMHSKFKTLLSDLAKSREEEKGAKVLIFSQFTQTIAWLKNEFKKQGINYRFISGDMPMKKRAQAIEAFQKDPPTTVFLLSIRTGAVGLTLTAASHVYMLEPCLNPALEEQAVGRCWRMGQERPVVIKRLYIQNSVEQNILKLLKTRHSSHVNTSSCQENSDSRGKSGGKGSFTEVAGCIRSDKQNLRLNEFEILFS
eukprot:Gb_33548 [translate_table: standard]